MFAPFKTSLCATDCKLHACSIIDMEVRADREAAIAKIGGVEGMEVRNAGELEDGWLWLEVS